MTSREIGLLLIVLGSAILGLGVLIWIGALSWFGRLPGDVRIEGERTRVWIPVTSMLLLSVLLSLLFWLVRRLRP